MTAVFKFFFYLALLRIVDVVTLMWSYDCILQVHKNANLRFMYAWLLHSLFLTLCPLVSLLCLMSLSCCSTCSHTVLVSPSTMELMMLKSATLYTCVLSGSEAMECNSFSSAFLTPGEVKANIIVYRQTLHIHA